MRLVWTRNLDKRVVSQSYVLLGVCYYSVFDGAFI